MSRLLKALAWVAPGAAAKRAAVFQALDLQKRYAGAAGGRRGASFLNGGGSANAHIGTHLAALRTRSREMVRDHWAFQRILDVVVGHSVGAGISIIPDNGSDRLDKQVASAFSEWSDEADICGESDLHGLIALMVRASLEGGDSVLKFIDTGSDDGRKVKLALQVWEGDVIDHARNGMQEGRRARLGVALGNYGRRDGAWLFPEHPGEMDALAVQSRFTARDDFIHLFRTLRPGQVRGVPVFAPVLMQARDLADLMDAVIVKAKIEACFAAFITKNGEPTVLNGLQKTENGQRITEFAPGMVYELKDGEDIKFANPSGSGAAFEPVYNATLYAMAAGAGITHDQLTGDLRQANYSSLRAGKIEFRRLIEQFQWLTIVPKALNRITARWASRAILSGALRERKEGYRWKYVMPANEPVDPRKDLEADIMAVRSGRWSPQEFLASWGRDWREVVADHAAFFKEADALGLTFDIDPRKTSQAGQAQNATLPAVQSEE